MTSRRGHNFLLIFAFIFLLFILNSCYRKGENIPVDPPTVSTHMADGWRVFEAGDYESAEDFFTSAKDRDALQPEAFLGLGWTQARLLKYDVAISNFRILQSISEEQSLLIDCYAGLAVCYAAGNDDEMAIENAEKVLELNTSYSFSHDSYIDGKAMNVVIARALINSADYLAALEVVENQIEPGFTESLKNAGILVEAIGLQSTPIILSSTIVDGSAILRLQKDRGGSNVPIELVKVHAVKDSLERVNYTVTGFQQGGSDIFIEGNPVPQEDDVLKADVVYARGYGEFLAELYEKIETLR
jgi:tetratricopeptide (TPR) repeat protein